MCAPIPTAAETLAPVCGCDNVTYWNESVAAAVYRVNVKPASTECPRSTAVKCTAQSGCDGNRVCNLAVGNVVQCATGAAAMGTCFGTPEHCPPGAAKFRQCNGAACLDPCDAIEAEKTFYSDGNCP